MKKLLWIGCLAYLLTGFTHVILGAVLPELLAHYQGTYSDGGRIVFIEFAGFLCGVLLMPRLAGAISRRRALLTAALLLGSAEVLLSLLPPWNVAMALAGMAGLGFGLTEGGIGTLVLIAAKEKQAVAMSRLEVFFGLGALLMPFISSFLIMQGVWRLSFLVLGISALAMIPVWAKMSFGELDELLGARKRGLRTRDEAETRAGGSGAESAAGSRRRSEADSVTDSGIGSVTDSVADSAAAAAGTVQQRGKEQPGRAPHYGTRGLIVLGLFICVFFFYVGAEVAIVNYLPSVFTDKLSLTSSAATLSVTAYWLAMVIGRLVAGNIAEAVTYRSFMLWSVAGTVVVLVGLAFTNGLIGAFAFVLASGLLMAGMFAVALIYANRLLPEALTERTTSLLIAAGGLGGSLLPLLVGRIMDAEGASAAVWSFAAAMLLMLVLLAAAAAAGGRERRTAAQQPSSH
ncbi:MFS transporter [Paenibacillus chartarius]|uniref:MFS transporter n=1 Tax=Paenibacillus chartarius TaxID=747481 RepID=A0ABV6DJC1_9BACL